MIQFCPLASGSRGNALYIADETTRLLVDVGLSTRQLERRLGEIGESLDRIDAILVTHEHSDHVRALKDVVRQYDIPVYVNRLTHGVLKDSLAACDHVFVFKTHDIFALGDFRIYPFLVMHDAVEPVGFRIQNGPWDIGVATDLGTQTQSAAEALKDVNVLMLESNHDLSLLERSRRPFYLKQRIRSQYGHLSNSDCASFVESILHEDLAHVYLAHLSQDCNEPKKALDETYEMFTRYGRDDISLNVTFQDRVSRKLSLREL